MTYLYPFKTQLAEVPNTNGNLARSAVLSFYDPADPTNTPVELFDLNGLPIGTTVTTNADGQIPPIQAAIPQLKWIADGGQMIGTIESYKGMFDQVTQIGLDAKASKDAAEQAIRLLSSPSGDVVAQVLSDPQSPARAVLDAAYALKGEAGTGGGTVEQWISEDPTDPGLFILSAGAPVVNDPTEEGFFLIASD
jgi:hypothetical protein